MQGGEWGVGVQSSVALEVSTPRQREDRFKKFKKND